MQTERHPHLPRSQTHIALDHIVGVSGDVPCQAKIADLGHPSLSKQDIPGSEVSVDTLTQNTTVRYAHTHEVSTRNVLEAHRSETLERGKLLLD